MKLGRRVMLVTDGVVKLRVVNVSFYCWQHWPMQFFSAVFKGRNLTSDVLCYFSENI